ncbi:hypothetical protein NDU88_000685 [Pleurodeles waltl]|uniref:Uncharacterized protein n=1 Tax=Pleurodeles waltl TaxID=8319 RepID=A0AAV7SAC5_PLEWA|nr:hypothetical protein NDU88_000685 [Pleurodeles waltl]
MQCRGTLRESAECRWWCGGAMTPPDGGLRGELHSGTAWQSGGERGRTDHCNMLGPWGAPCCSGGEQETSSSAWGLQSRPLVVVGEFRCDFLPALLWSSLTVVSPLHGCGDHTGVPRMCCCLAFCSAGHREASLEESWEMGAARRGCVH